MSSVKFLLKVMFFMNKRSVDRHVKDSDYFATLATVISQLRQYLERNKTLKKDLRSVMLSVERDLVYLHENYLIVPKDAPQLSLSEISRMLT